MTDLPGKIVDLHHALDAARLPHAFGGALALAWCTERARGTIDIDVNVFVPAADADHVIAALPDGVRVDGGNRAQLLGDGQTRLWWDTTPVDLFLDTTDFHLECAGRVRVEAFGGVDVPFLACRDLAVFKAFFSRTRDWADLEEMRDAGTLDIDAVTGVLVRHLGLDDERVARLHTLLQPVRE